MLQRPGAIVAGKFRLEKPLARGGVGTVWVARHVQLGHEVAVKFLDPSVAASAQVRTRFEREARAAAHLRTPHIVQVFDYGIQSDTPYLVMELLHGETLGARLRRVKRMPLGDAFRILVQIGKGLRKAHEVGFVHRDLKPANLYLSRAEEDEEEVVKILDFGIAKEMSGELVGESTKTGELVGSPHYMSPEQIRGEREVDARTDLWALGVILYKMITAYLPFPGEVLTAVITKIVIDPIPSARDYLPDSPPQLDAFFAKALARDRSQRFQNVRELVQAFGEVAALEAGVASAQLLMPITGGSLGAGGSSPDLSSYSPFRSAFPSSFPGGSGAVSIPGAPGLGALGSGSNPGSLGSGSSPGSVSGPPLAGSFSSGTPVPGESPDSASRPPVPSIPSIVPSSQSFSGPVSSLTSANASVTNPPGPSPRKARWPIAAIAAAIVVGGAALILGSMGFGSSVRDRAASTGQPAASPAEPTTLAPAVTPEPTSSAGGATVAPAPSATASAAASSASTTAAAAADTSTAAPTQATSTRPRAVPGSGRARPAGGKKPVDTID